MEKERIYRVGLDVIYMASCALRNQVPERFRLSEMDFARLYKMAKRHSMEAIVYLSLNSANEKYADLNIDPDLLSRWKRDYHETIKRLVQLDLERENLYAFLESEGSWYVGLKGIVLSHYYPTLGMRQMTDNDILIDPAFAKKIRGYFENRGYTVYSYGNHCHDVYVKGSLTFEIHRMLAEDVDKTKAAYKYYKDVKRILIPDEGAMSMSFSKEDFYVYYVFHAYKHFSHSGCGLRTLMDMFVYTSKEEGLNYNYICGQLKILGIDGYEKRWRKLAELLFCSDVEEVYSPNLLTGEESETLLCYISSGTFGTTERMIENTLLDLADGAEITAATRLKYILKRLFPKYEFYKTSYPVASKFIVTIPILWLLRVFRSLLKGRKISKELKQINTKK